jgi:hypothetical protein
METPNFEKAMSVKLRFESSQGLLTTEDVAHLPLEVNERERQQNKASLDSISRPVLAAIRANGEVSLIVKKSEADDLLQLKLDIIKFYIARKQDAEKAKVERQEKKAERERLLALKADKKDEAMKQLTPEQIDARLKEIDADLKG